MSIETLDHLSLLEISGDDAIDFLQGQLTNDIKLANQTWQYSGYCNPKGRLLALFQLWNYQNKVYALLDSSLVDSIVKRLRMYVMRSKVNIKVSESANYGIFGTDNLAKIAPNLTQEEHANLSKQHAFYSNGNLHILNYKERYLCIADTPLSDHAEHTNLWLKQNILEGFPEVRLSSSELFIPQMLNLDVLNGINFKKGCYTGQEIVARMHYLGKVKQRMFVCELNNTDPVIEIGAKVYGDQSLGKSIGHIVSVHEQLALAVLRVDESLEQINYFLSETTQLRIRENQPYSLASKN